MVDDQSQSTPPQKPKKKSLWERWRSWSGSFLVMSVLLHVILLGGATLLVVQVVQARKEKLKFTAPPPSANAGAEHKVKPSKKTAAPAPAVSKRITSTAVNASVALPPMEMNSTGPDVMASVMSGLGSAGLGAGMGAGAGMSSMPLQGLTAFGFKGDLKSAGLVGHLYDLKQTKDRKPTEIKDDGLLKDRTQEQDKNYHGQGYDNFKLALTDPKKRNLLADGVVNDAKVINDFFSRSWDPHVLDAYYQSPDPVTAYQFAIPAASPADAVKAFGVENTVKPNHFLVHYQGTIIPPRDGMYRFVATVNNGMFAVRLDGQNVLGVVSPLISSSLFKVTPENPAPYYGWGATAGQWVQLQEGKKYPIEILMTVGGYSPTDFSCALQVEEKNPPNPYLLSDLQWQSKQGLQYQKGDALLHPNIYRRLPLFALMKGLPPSPPFKYGSFDFPKNTTAERIESFKKNGPWYSFPDVAPEPLVFKGSK